MIRNKGEEKIMKRLLMCVVVLAVCAGASFAAVGDTWNANSDFDWPTPAAPWSYVWQQGSAWDGTFSNFQNMISYEIGPNLGDYGYQGENTAIWYGPLCGIFGGHPYGLFTMSSVIPPDGYVTGQAFFGFTAPEAGTYNIKGYAFTLTGFATSVSDLLFGNDAKGLLWNYTAPETTPGYYNVTAVLAAGETIYFGQKIVVPSQSVYQSTPVFWGTDITQVPEPMSLMVIGSGMLGLLGFARRRRS